MRSSIAAALIRGALVTLAVTFAPAAFARCNDCGTVVNLKRVERPGEATGGGAVIGGIAGGVLGHQIGSGRGNTAATIAGAAGGAYAGHEIEKNRNKTVSYEVVVKFEDGRTRTFTYGEQTGFRMGDRVKIVDHRLTHY